MGVKNSNYGVTIMKKVTFINEITGRHERIMTSLLHTMIVWQIESTAR
jgi:hypothetical protein